MPPCIVWYCVVQLPPRTVWYSVPIIVHNCTEGTTRWYNSQYKQVVVQLVQVQVVQRQIELYHCSQLHWRYILPGGTTACTCTSRGYSSLLVVVLAGGRETDRAPPNT